MLNGSPTRPRVLLLIGFMAPARIALFTELAARFSFEAWILADVRRIRPWRENLSEAAFTYRMVPSLRIPTGNQDYQVILNYSLPFALVRHRHDVLVTAGWDTPAAFYTAHYAALTKTPFVLWAGSTAHENNWRRSLGRCLVRSVVKRAGAWVAYGARSKDYLASLGADPQRVFCAYNAVDTAPFADASHMTEDEKAAFKRRLGLGPGRLVFYCGQLIARKGLADLLPAFAKAAQHHPDLTLVVAGSGPRRAQFQALAEAGGVGERTLFAGHISRSDLPQYYAAADLFALPSREEVWGLVINEALATGTPVLTTAAVGAAPDLVRHGENGYVAPANDPDALADIMLRHFGPQTDLPAMRRAARDSIAPFTIARSADAFQAAVQCALERHRRQAQKKGPG